MALKGILGLSLSIIGLWFTSAGLIGEKRLRSLEKRLRENIYGKNGLMKKVLLAPINIIRQIFTWSYPLIGTVTIFLVVGFALHALIIIGLWLFTMKDVYELDEPLLELVITLPFACYLGLLYVVFKQVLVFMGAMLALPIVIAILLLLLSALVWLSLVPYVIADLIAMRTRLESSIILLGVVLGTIGIMLLEL